VPANFRFAWTKNGEILLLHMGHKVLTQYLILVLVFLT
jgi:hypothetical protein